MMEKNMEGALKRMESWYPTSDFNADLLEQEKDLRAKCKEIKAKFVPPHLVVYHFDEHNKKRSSIVMFENGLPDEPKEKFGVFAMIGQKMAGLTHGILSAFFVSESWIVRQDLSGKVDTSIRPSESPNRSEVVVIVGCTVDQRNNQLIIPITGRTKSEALKLGESEVHNSSVAKDGEQVAKFESPLFEGFWMGYANSLFGKIQSRMEEGRSKVARIRR